MYFLVLSLYTIKLEVTYQTFLKVHNHGFYVQKIEFIKYDDFGYLEKRENYMTINKNIPSSYPVVFMRLCVVLLEIFNSSIKRIACYYYTSTIIHHS